MEVNILASRGIRVLEASEFNQNPIPGQSGHPKQKCTLKTLASDNTPQVALYQDMLT